MHDKFENGMEIGFEGGVKSLAATLRTSGAKTYLSHRKVHHVLNKEKSCIYAPFSGTGTILRDKNTFFGEPDTNWGAVIKQKIPLKMLKRVILI